MGKLKKYQRYHNWFSTAPPFCCTKVQLKPLKLIKLNYQSVQGSFRAVSDRFTRPQIAWNSDQFHFEINFTDVKEPPELKSELEGRPVQFQSSSSAVAQKHKLDKNSEQFQFEPKLWDWKNQWDWTIKDPVQFQSSLRAVSEQEDQPWNQRCHFMEIEGNWPKE